MLAFNPPRTHWHDGGELDPHGGKEELGKGKKNRPIRNSWEERGERGERGQVHDSLAFFDHQGHGITRHGRRQRGGRGAGPVATVEEEDDAFAKNLPRHHFLIYQRVQQQFSEFN